MSNVNSLIHPKNPRPVSGFLCIWSQLGITWVTIIFWLPTPNNLQGYKSTCGLHCPQCYSAHHSLADTVLMIWANLPYNLFCFPILASDRIGQIKFRHFLFRVVLFHRHHFMISKARNSLVNYLTLQDKALYKNISLWLGMSKL